MSSSFEAALPWILSHEGGWSDDPSDPGGATNFGITLATAQRHGIMTKNDLLAITPAQVAAIYRADYWRFDEVADQAVAMKLFDMAVNMGLGTAVKLAQECLNDLGASLAVDGRMGSRTLAMINSVRPASMVDMLCMESEEHYQAIVVRRPESRKFLRGWLRRAAERPRA